MNDFTNKTSLDVTNKKSRFILTKKNQKGQVAVFVALIFQVIFVFFAVLINVGLLVHHKINLQQSTDLAAYYGAMKQAEGLNAIAHINFQIKQAWKLLTWRYRILGTFGFQKDAGQSQNYPFEFKAAPGAFFYNGSAANGMTCSNIQVNGEALGIQDIPFFCVGHPGFRNWPQSESNCKLNCNGFENGAQMGLVTPPSTGGGTAATFLNLVATQITNVNDNIIDKCQRLGPDGAALFTRFIAAYIMETNPRLRTIEALAANLTLDADKVLDIEGKSIQGGSLLTFKNNLTEANRDGFQVQDFTAVNGLISGNGASNCKFQDGLDNKPEFLKKIEIQYINYFIHNCRNTGTAQSPSVEYKPENVFNPNGGLGSAFTNLTNDEKAVLESLSNIGQHHTVGYEKNPHCVEYYAVKASTTPQIPFLPLAKITLNAVAVAKPFGGSIGPWFYKTWGSDATQSEGDPVTASARMDENLPMKAPSGTTTTMLTQSLGTQPNFSLYVGDTEGLRNLDYIAAYHSALAVRDIKNYGANTSYESNKNTANQLKNSGPWPDYTNWDGINNMAMSDKRFYDTLATNDPEKAGMRALEITAIAPNQFDITHYSIDPDFYNNYYKKLYSGLPDILEATGRRSTMVPNDLRADFGAVGMDADAQLPPLSEKTFSVKDQILLKNQVLNTAPSISNGMAAPNVNKTYAKILNHLVSLQSSLLTAWTFLNFSNYKDFPKDPVNTARNTMSFGQCEDSWNKTDLALSNPTSDEYFRTPMDIDPKLPPTPGNCVTGGRTGYSVKIISPNMVRGGDLKNPLDDSFFNF